MKKFRRRVYLSCSLLVLALTLINVFSQDQITKSLSEVISVQSQYETVLFQNPNVKAVGIGLDSDKKEYNLSVYVLPGTDPAWIPSSLEDVPVRIKETKPVVALDDGPAHRRQQSPPVKLGVSVSNTLGCFAGTMGFKVCDVSNPGIKGYVTNNHIAAAAGPYLCPNEAGRSTWQTHLARYDNDCRQYALIIGFLERFIRIDYRDDNTVDAAFVKENGQNTVSQEILDIGIPTSNPRDPNVGDIVLKSGRTTGLTSSQVTEINASVDVEYGWYCGTARFVGQIITDNTGRFVDAGDSGSPVVDDQNNPVGLIFAGSDEIAVFNPILEVFARLNVQVDCDF